MAFKRKIATILVALSAVSAIGITASAADFNLKLNAGTTKVTDSPIKKNDNASAIVTTRDGIYNCYITYAVRTSDGKANASDSVKATELNTTYWMKYRSGYGYKDNYYTLSGLLNSGQAITTTTASGTWVP